MEQLIENTRLLEHFTKKPNAKKVWIKGRWVQSLKAYECQDADDISNFAYIKKGKLIYTI